MSILFSKIIAGGIVAIGVWLIYFCISGLLTVFKNRKERSQKNFSSTGRPKNGIETKETNILMVVTETNQSMDKSKYQFMTSLNIRAFFFVIIGCLSLYYATQCNYYDQFSGMGSYFFGKDNELEHIANEMSSQILSVGMQARETITIIKLFKDLFIIIGVCCVTYGVTSFKKK